MKKMMLILFAVMFVASTAWAGNIPEFDAVGCDWTNVFAANNAAQYGQVVTNVIGPNGQLNKFSAGWYDWVKIRDVWVQVPVEYFKQTAGQLFPDPCFGTFGLLSALVDVWNEAIYEWFIVLQMKPESDLNINIYDCVLKHNEFSPWGYAEQTGRYRAADGQLWFVKSANPSITVKAYPGPYATPGFVNPFILTARTLPKLDPVPLDGVLYTSKGIWSEGIVVEMPVTTTTTWALKHGDRIYVKVTVPFNNSADIRYGADSVIVKYIGIVGTYYYGVACP